MTALIGYLIGFFASIPIGPINLLALSQALKRGFVHGFSVGLVGGLCVSLYCFAASYGLSFIPFNLKPLIPYGKALAVFILVILSIRLFRSANDYRPTDPKPEKSSAHSPIIAAFLLFMTNPSIYAFWLAVVGFAGTHRLIHPDDHSYFVFAISCGAGAITWFLIITRYAAKYHHQFTPRTFKYIFNFMGICLIGFALYTFISIFMT